MKTTYHLKNNISSKNLSADYANKIALFEIAVKMKNMRLPNHFIVEAVKTALEFEGVSDLMHLWSKEHNKKEKEEIIADIQEMIDACSEKPQKIFINFDDLDTIAKNVRAFKNGLLEKVIEFGGISKLSELTGLPQPSLSRFFNSNAIPQRGTILKIQKVLKLEKIEIADWNY